jgi:hypothetical protein
MRFAYCSDQKMMCYLRGEKSNSASSPSIAAKMKKDSFHLKKSNIGEPNGKFIYMFED